MTQRLEITDGKVIVIEDLPDNLDGSEAKRTWSTNADQAGKHVDGGMWKALSAGDKSALADCVNEARKEAARQK